MKYLATVTGWGEDALEFLKDPESNFIVLFNENCPEELAEIAVLHTEATLLAEPVLGDILIFCEKVYDITAVGSEAIHTLRELGHCTLSFKGGSAAERPGCIQLAGDPPSPEDIVVGGTIEIH